MRPVLHLLPVLLLSSLWLSAGNDTLKHYSAVRITNPPKIDGVLDDACWQNIPGFSDFVQRLPDENRPPTQRTEVKIAYDDQAIYVGAFMYDTYPDSILAELGSRDAGGLNADDFRIIFDTYNSRQDAFFFQVYASGVQVDGRFSDYTYNAVWESKTKINDQGWVAEFRIPYSAIRFPNQKNQNWSMQATRGIRRLRELDQWCLIPSGSTNIQKFYGFLDGIEDIQPPLRLSFNPYVSSYYERVPSGAGNNEFVEGFSYNVGADVKYGISESFTLDMILFPDFGQAQTDRRVKNLSYREVIFAENREFFREGTDLFNQGGLFYSRRIGRTPGKFYSVPFLLKPGETLEKNPAQTNLINAFKVSGRTLGKTGIGILNAITAEMNAVVRDSTGETYKILTEPMANYNLFVVDQQFNNNRSIGFMNTNVLREGNFRDANVSALGFYGENKKNTLSVEGDFTYSHVLLPDPETGGSKPKTGTRSNFEIGKIGGAWEYSASVSSVSRDFDPSDLGFLVFGNFTRFSADVEHRTFVPGKRMRNTNTSLSLDYSYFNETGKPTGSFINAFFFGTNLKFHSFYGGFTVSPLANYDYFEPRIPGRVFRTWEWYYMNFGISSDYRRKLALDGNVRMGNFLPGNFHNFKSPPGGGFRFGPRYRFSNKFSLTYNIDWDKDPYNPGFATMSPVGDIVFGGRSITTISHSVFARYLFKNDMALTLTGRHYWSSGVYKDYYFLNDDGSLNPALGYTGENDYNFTAYSIDLVYSWWFAPGSQLTLVYKNIIDNDQVGSLPRPNYPNDFMNSFTFPMTNSISFKAFYWLDYLYLVKKKKKQDYGNGKG
jgi:hypothetical protein